MLMIKCMWMHTCVVLAIILERQDASPCSDGSLALYGIQFEGLWSKEMFPKVYPVSRPKAEWSSLLGRSHSRNYSLFTLGQLISEPLRQFVELSTTKDLDQEGQGQLNILDTFTSPPLSEGSGTTSARYFADGNHSLISFVVKMVPSPDWFVGVDSVDMCSNGVWQQRLQLDLQPYDGGTQRGYTFSAPRWKSDPQQPIFQITSRYPNHTADAFFYPQLSTLPPIARVNIKLINTMFIDNPIASQRPSRIVSMAVSPILETTVASPTLVSVSSSEYSHLRLSSIPSGTSQPKRASTVSVITSLLPEVKTTKKLGTFSLKPPVPITIRNERGTFLRPGTPLRVKIDKGFRTSSSLPITTPVQKREPPHTSTDIIMPSVASGDSSTSHIEKLVDTTASSLGTRTNADDASTLFNAVHISSSPKKFQDIWMVTNRKNIPEIDSAQTQNTKSDEYKGITPTSFSTNNVQRARIRGDDDEDQPERNFMETGSGGIAFEKAGWADPHIVPKTAHLQKETDIKLRRTETATYTTTGAPPVSEPNQDIIFTYADDEDDEITSEGSGQVQTTQMAAKPTRHLGAVRPSTTRVYEPAKVSNREATLNDKSTRSTQLNNVTHAPNHNVLSNHILPPDGNTPKGYYLGECLVSDWSPWSDCSRTCGYGVKVRTRNVVKRTDNRPCPELHAEQLCGSMRKCNWQHFSLNFNSTRSLLPTRHSESELRQPIKKDGVLLNAELRGLSAKQNHRKRPKW